MSEKDDNKYQVELADDLEQSLHYARQLKEQCEALIDETDLNGFENHSQWNKIHNKAMSIARHALLIAETANNARHTWECTAVGKIFKMVTRGTTNP